MPISHGLARCLLSPLPSFGVLVPRAACSTIQGSLLNRFDRWISLSKRPLTPSTRRGPAICSPRETSTSPRRPWENIKRTALPRSVAEAADEADSPHRRLIPAGLNVSLLNSL